MKTLVLQEWPHSSASKGVSSEGSRYHLGMHFDLLVGVFVWYRQPLGGVTWGLAGAAVEVTS